jgi:IS5 family transposase
LPVSKSLGVAGVYDDLLAQVCRQIENHGLKLHQAEAAIIGATLIESAAHPRTQIKAPLDREKGDIQEDPQIRFSADEDARWAKNGS